MKSSKEALLVLTTAALALPGMTPKTVHAQAVPENFTASYRFNQYQEDGQPGNKSFSGEAVERFDISVHQFSLAGPISDNFAISLNALTETLSGASPWWVEPSLDDDVTPVTVMSGATIEESRDEINLSISNYGESSRTGYGVSTSRENDYNSLSANINRTLWFNNNDTTIDFGYSFSIDELTPTQLDGVSRVTEEDKNRNTFFVGFSQVVNKGLVVGGNFSYSIHNGFLSDPYKLAYVGTGTVADSRPDTRKQAALDLLLRQYFPSISTALHVDYRRYNDSWAVTSNTFSAGPYVNVGDWQVSLVARLYQQSSSNFYRAFYNTERADGYYSSDYRLSNYEATSYRLGLSRAYEFATLYMRYEDYTSSGDNPGLVSFNFFTLGLDYKF